MGRRRSLAEATWSALASMTGTGTGVFVVYHIVSAHFSGSTSTVHR